MRKKKITWKVIFSDFKERRPKYADNAIWYRPYHFATILIYLDDGRMCTYNYDTKKISFLKDKWKND